MKSILGVISQGGRGVELKAQHGNGSMEIGFILSGEKKLSCITTV